MENWYGTWPMQEGFYWFYGWAFGYRKENEPQLTTVRVQKVGREGEQSLMYTAYGTLLYEGTGRGIAVGIWQPIKTTIVPLTPLTKLLKIKDN